jgi:hypothetical protein
VTTSRILRRTLGALCIATATAGLAAGPAAADTIGSDCTNPVLSTPFSAFKDQRLYTLAPGGTFDNAASGWNLSGGASIVQAQQPDGTVAGVLDLPSQAVAISPPMCVTADYPTARLWVRNLVGAEGVGFNVSYYVNGAWTDPKSAGQFHGDHGSWTYSNSLNLHPAKPAGWQKVRFIFIANGTKSHFQVDDFWVDPRMRA